MKTEQNDNTFPGNNSNDYYRPGLTKREYFSAIAMQGLIANNVDESKFAEYAVSCADKLIKELNKSTNNE